MSLLRGSPRVKFFGEIGVAAIRQDSSAQFQLTPSETPLLQALSSFKDFDFCHYFDPFLHDFGTSTNPNIWCIFEFMGQVPGRPYVQTAIGAAKLSIAESGRKSGLQAGFDVAKVSDFDTVLVLGDRKSDFKSLPVSYPQVISIQGKSVLAVENYWGAGGISLYSLELRAERPAVQPLGQVATKAFDCNILWTPDGFFYWGTDLKYRVLGGYFTIEASGVKQWGEFTLKNADNPLFTRNAGTPQFFDQLWRPFQDCSSHYGKRLGLAKFEFDEKDPEGSLRAHYGDLAAKQADDCEKLFATIGDASWTREKYHHITTLHRSPTSDATLSQTEICLIDGGRYMMLDGHGTLSAQHWGT